MMIFMLNPIILEVDSISIFSGISCLQGGSPIVFRYTFGAFVKVSCSMSIFLNVSNNFFKLWFLGKSTSTKMAHSSRNISYKAIKRTRKVFSTSLDFMAAFDEILGVHKLLSRSPRVHLR